MAIKKKTYSFRGGDIIDTEEFHDGKYGAPGGKRTKRKKATPEEMARVNKRNKETRCRQRPFRNIDIQSGGTSTRYDICQKGFFQVYPKNPERV